MRARAGFLGGILVLLIGAAVAWLAYQAGLSQAATTAVATGTATAAPVVVYGGWAFGGFHVFGIIFGLIFLFVMARIVFGLLFWHGPRHWGGRHGGFGPEGPGAFGGGGFGPGRSPWGPMGRGEGHTFIAEMHRRMHEEDAAAHAGSTGSGGAGAPPASDHQPTA